MTLESHPAANLFPLLHGAAFESFKKDISERGLIEAIWLCEDKILDGRNRYRACIELDIEPQFRVYSGDSPVSFAWSLNGERRHLTNGQRSAIAVEMLPALQEEARKRQATSTGGPEPQLRPDLGEADKKGKAVAAAAEIVGVGATNVQYAKAVKERDPQVFEQLKSGELTVEKARQRTRDKPPLNKPSRTQPLEKRIADITRLAAEGNRASQIAQKLHISEHHVRKLARDASITLADKVLAGSHRVNARRVIEQTIQALEGCALGLKATGIELDGISASDAKEWAELMKQPLTALARFRTQLLRHANE